MSSEPQVASDELVMTQLEMGLAVLRKACDQAVDKLGGAVPGVQLRALLIFDDAGGSLDTRQLAAELTISGAAASKVCDRMQEAGLMTVEDTSSQGALRCVLTDSGIRLARWVKDQQRIALSKVVYSMRPSARDALIHGLRELAATTPQAS